MKGKRLLGLFKFLVLLFGLIASCTVGNKHYYVYDYDYGCGCWYEFLNGDGRLLEGWYAETVESAGDAGMHSSLAVDLYDAVHISYFGRNTSYWGGGVKDSGDDDEYSYWLKYAKKLVGKWLIYTVDFAGNTVEDTDIAVDSKGNAHIGYSGWEVFDDDIDDDIDDDVDCDQNHPPELLAVHYFLGSEELPLPVEITPEESSSFGIYFEYADVDCNLPGGHFYNNINDEGWSDFGVLPEELGCSTADSGLLYGFGFSEGLDVGAYTGQTRWTDVCGEESNTLGWEFTVADGYVAGGVGGRVFGAAGGFGYGRYGYGSYGGVFYATNAGGNWNALMMDVDGADVSLAVDSEDAVHIVYCSYGGLKYATNASGSWESVVIDATCGSTSIVVDSDGSVHVSYYGYPDTLKYASNASGAWRVEVVDSGRWIGSHSDIAIDSDGKVHISYQDSNKRRLRYATNASGGWERCIVDTIGDVGPYGSAAMYPSIAVDSVGFVHMSYRDANKEALKYATNSSGEWQTFSIDTRGNTGYYTSIAVDSEGYVHMSYFNSSKDSLIYVTNREPK